MTVSEHRDLVSALLGVPGVAAAAVEPVGSGPGMLRLQLTPGADEVGVAGAVNRLLRSRFGLAVDTDRVRVLDEPRDGRDESRDGGDRPRVTRRGPVVQPDPPEQVADVPAAPAAPDAAQAANGHQPNGHLPTAEAAPESPDAPDAEVEPSPPEVSVGRPGRLLIERVQLVSAGLTTSVTVTLGRDGRTYDGHAEGTASAGSLQRSVAHATLRAVEAVVGGTVRFDVEHLEVAATGPDRTALVVVTLVTGRATQRLSGASVVREDVRQAVIRAVLAAVNRRLEPMLARADQDS